MGISRQLPETLVRDNLYNWLGFGNLNGKYWFIGREEFDPLGPCQYLNNIRDYYEVRREFGYAEDFVETWKNVYGRSLEQGTSTMSTRHVQAAFLLAFEGISPKGKASQYIFTDKKFGRRDSNHFSGEVFPLRYHPKKRETFNPYRSVWNVPEQYEEEVLPKRIEIYLTQLRKNPDVKVIISYAETKEFVDPLRSKLEHEFIGTRPANKQNEFGIWEIFLGNKREILLIDSPFFGQGHVGYSQIEAFSNEIPKLI